MIDTYLKGQSEQEDHVIHLLFSANRWEAAYASLLVLTSSSPCPFQRLTQPSTEITTAISAGIDVIVDRYYYSGIVYSAAKQNPSLSLEWARKPDEGLPRPDVCIYITISPDEAAKRGGFGEERYEKREMQERVRGLFGELQKASEKEDFIEIDGGRALDEVERDVLKAVEARMGAVRASGKGLRTVQPW